MCGFHEFKERVEVRYGLVNNGGMVVDVKIAAVVERTKCQGLQSTES